jgi:Ca-activated chloride channel family protein
VTITVPTAFLSANNGGIFASVGKAGSRSNLPAAPLAAGEKLLDLQLSYVGAGDGKRGSDRLAVAAPKGEGSPALHLGHLLVDEYLTLKEASLAFHREGDPKKAFRLLSALQGRLERSGLDKLEGEKLLVAQMLEPAALYSGYGGEPPKEARAIALVGEWRVSRVDGPASVASGDRVTFTDGGDVWTRRRDVSRDEQAEYEVDGARLTLSRGESERSIFTWRVTPTTLSLASEDGLTRLVLRRVATAARD